MSKPDLFYLSSVFSSTNKGDQERNYQNVLVAASLCIKAKVAVYSPIVHNHHLSNLIGCGTGWEDWRDHDITTLSHCSGLLLLVTPNWERSVGMMAELRFAIENNIPYWPVYFVDDYIGIWDKGGMAVVTQNNMKSIMSRWRDNQIQEGSK